MPLNFWNPEVGKSCPIALRYRVLSGFFLWCRGALDPERGAGSCPREALQQGAPSSKTIVQGWVDPGFGGSGLASVPVRACVLDLSLFSVEIPSIGSWENNSKPPTVQVKPSPWADRFGVRWRGMRQLGVHAALGLCSYVSRTLNVPLLPEQS